MPARYLDAQALVSSLSIDVSGSQPDYLSPGESGVAMGWIWYGVDMGWILGMGKCGVDMKCILGGYGRHRGRILNEGTDGPLAAWIKHRSLEAGTPGSSPGRVD